LDSAIARYLWLALWLGISIASVLHVIPDAMLIPSLAIAGFGFGVAFPTLIKVVVSGVAAHHAGLASGMVITALQISAALGVAVIGGVFYSVLGNQTDVDAYKHAFAVALTCNVIALTINTLLSLALKRSKTVVQTTVTPAVEH
jgi:MFS family permease